MPQLTRLEIPEALRAAKQRAVTDYLLAPRKRSYRRVHRVTSDPTQNLVGVGVGRKIVKGKKTARTSVRFYVAQKLDAGLVPQGHLLPRTIEGVETDVVQVGRLRAQVLSSRQRRRPARPGCSIGFRLGAPDDDLLMAGTLGAVVARGEKRFILSNNHVLANENELAPGAAIYQPGLLDHGDPGTDAIARLSQFAPLSSAGPNRVDCAIAEIVDPELVGTRVSSIGKLGSAQPIAVVEGMSVEKVGRGSGHTTGEVLDVNGTMTLGYEMGDLTFVDQVLVRGRPGPFSDYGDSGALVVDAGSRRGAGLLIGGSSEVSVANHIEDVLSELGLSLVP